MLCFISQLKMAGSFSDGCHGPLSFIIFFFFCKKIPQFYPEFTVLVTDSYQCNEIQERLITFMSNSILNHILEFNNCHRIPPSPELAAPVMQKLFKIDRKVYFRPHTHTHCTCAWILECVHVVDPICARFKLLKKNLIERAETHKRRRRKICPWFKPEVFCVCVCVIVGT